MRTDVSKYTVLEVSFGRGIFPYESRVAPVRQVERCLCLWGRYCGTGTLLSRTPSTETYVTESPGDGLGETGLKSRNFKGVPMSSSVS